MKKVSWVLYLAGALCATAQQQTTIGNIQYYGLTHSSIRWTFTTQGSNPVCYQVRFGTASGQYPYQSNSLCNSDQKISLAIGGLAPSTTYYFRLTARPQPDDETGICQSDDCGSAEQSVTTLPEPAIHPQLPQLPSQWVPQHPDTTSYSIVPIQNGPNSGECVAGADVPAAGAHANDTITALLNEIPYGTVLEFQPGMVCPIPVEWNSGYVLPVKPLDPDSGGDINSPAHKWIVFRTAQLNPADFPSYGSRTGAQWSGNLAKLVALAPTNWYGTSPGKGRGQIFDAENGGQHHFWFENLEFTTTSDPSLLPPSDTTDPLPYSPLFAIFSTFANIVPPDISYIVLDRLYLHGQGFPSRYTRAVTLGGQYQAMIGCDLEDLDFWQVAITPQVAPTLTAANRSMYIPASSYARNANDPLTGTSQAALAVLEASANYTGSYLLQLGPAGSGLTVRYSTPVLGTASVYCTNCAAVQETTPSVPSNAYTYCSGAIANGQFSAPDCSLAVWQTTGYGYGWGTIGIELMDGGTGPYYLANNYLGAVGMGLYVDAGGDAFDRDHQISYADNSNNDVAFIRNHMIWPQDHRITSNVSNGFHYPVRNLFEMKRGRRWLIQGNLFQGHWSYQNDGSAILLAGAADSYPITNAVTGILDQTVISNIIRHGAAGIEAAGPLAFYAAGEQPGNIQIENNLMYDLAARLVYSDGDPSLYTGFLAGGFRDMTFRHNTVGLTYGNMPAMLYANASAALMEGFSYTNNILYFSQGGTGGGIWIAEGDGIQSHLRLPHIDRSNYKTMLDTSYVRTQPNGILPNYRFDTNVIIGGKLFSDSGQDIQDMTNGQIIQFSAKFPAGNYFVTATSDSLADREAAVGFTNVANWDYRLASSSPFAQGGVSAADDGNSMGVDYDRLQSDMGLVTNIGPVTIAGSTATFTYRAPDVRACTVDVSSDGITWSRAGDGGGPRQRQAVVGSLQPNTQYQYRILCYYRQVNDGAVYTEYTDDQITDGVFGTSDSSFPGRLAPRQVKKKD